MTDLHLTGTDHVRVYVNGDLVCEAAAGVGHSRDDLEAEVRRARAALALVESIIPSVIAEAGRCDCLPGEGMKPEQKRDAWARGLRDGLANRLEDHPYGPTIPGILPEHNGPYRAGWDCGQAIRRAGSLAATPAPQGAEGEG